MNLPIGPSEKLAGSRPTGLNLTRLIPMQMRRRGIEMKFVVNGDSKASLRTDPALLKMIARAHCWFDDLASGRASSMVEIGKREKVGKRYVSRIIRLAFLAPDSSSRSSKAASRQTSPRNLCRKITRNFRSPGNRSIGRLDFLS